MTPALSKEEWGTWPNWPIINRTDDQDEGGGLPLYYPTKHGIAAANLHGQPFGFTHEDVELLTGGDIDTHYAADHKVIDEHLRSLAQRISALLPPEARTLDKGQP